jgi:hypothetical protein
MKPGEFAKLASAVLEKKAGPWQTMWDSIASVGQQEPDSWSKLGPRSQFLFGSPDPMRPEASIENRLRRISDGNWNYTATPLMSDDDLGGMEGRGRVRIPYNSAGVDRVVYPNLQADNPLLREHQPVPIPLSTGRASAPIPTDTGRGSKDTQYSTRFDL